MTSVSKTRRLDIDTLRGLACLLLVSFHVVGVPDAGLRLPETHWLVRMNDVLAYLRMPLFSFISGYVYAMRPVQHGAGPFLRGKVRRLLLPLLTVGTLFAVVQSLTPGANAAVKDWRLLHVMPVGHFWFLEALFLIFVLLVVLERMRVLATFERFALVFGGSVLVFLFADVPDYFAASGAAFLLPFFLAGLACRRFDIHSWFARGLAAVLLVAAASWLTVQADGTREEALAGLVIGLSSAFLLLRSGWQVRGLALIGAYSFSIYLMHVFFTAGSRILFSTQGLTDPYLHFLLGTIAGITGPIVATHFFSRFALLELFFLGKLRRTSA